MSTCPFLWELAAEEFVFTASEVAEFEQLTFICRKLTDINRNTSPVAFTRTIIMTLLVYC